MIRRPPRSTPKPSSAASDVYKRQQIEWSMSQCAKILFLNGISELGHKKQTIQQHTYMIEYYVLHAFFMHNIRLSKDISMYICLLYTSPSPRDLSTSRMPSSA